MIAYIFNVEHKKNPTNIEQFIRMLERDTYVSLSEHCKDTHAFLNSDIIRLKFC